MAMGIVSDSEFDLEKSKLIREESNPNESETIPNGIIKNINRGRGHNPEVPDGLRKIIGEESQINGRQSGIELASRFGVSPSSVSAYGNGATSTASYNEPNKELVNNLNSAKDRVSQRAMNKLKKALHHITDDKLVDAKPRDLAGIAKDMSAIIKNMEPDVANPNDGKNGPTFVLYAPQYRDERSFDIVQAKE